MEHLWCVMFLCWLWWISIKSQQAREENRWENRQFQYQIINQGRDPRKDGEEGLLDFILKTIGRHWGYISCEVAWYVLFILFFFFQAPGPMITSCPDTKKLCFWNLLMSIQHVEQSSCPTYGIHNKTLFWYVLYFNKITLKIWKKWKNILEK